jgi:hypothetical protein
MARKPMQEGQIEEGHAIGRQGFLLYMKPL